MVFSSIIVEIIIWRPPLARKLFANSKYGLPAVFMTISAPCPFVRSKIAFLISISFERFITSTLPRVRDFQGLESRGFDGRGNFTIGIKEQIAFPEISIDKVNKITGMDITFVTSTDSDEESLILLKEFGLPFKEGSTQSKDSENKDKNKTPKDNNETPDEINIEEDNQQKDNSTDEINSEIKVEKEPSENVKENDQDLSKDVDKSAK